MLILFTVVLTVIVAVGHAVVAVFTPKEANAPPDEREKKITTLAGHISGYVFGAGVITSLVAYLVVYDGNVLFYGVFASLVISQLAEYLIQIFCFRRGI